MKSTWRCLVCGYAHDGAEAPESCPVCGAGRSQFVEKGHAKARFVRDVYDTFLFHAVIAHVPNGLLPAGALFLTAALLTGNAHFERTAFHLVALTVLSVPLSALSGVRDWKRRYGGRKVPVFYRKMALSAALFALGLVAVGLRLTAPDLFDRGGGVKAAYVLTVFSMLGPAVLLGHFGGKLVFYWKKR
jgi:hypothetical protein